MSEKDRGTGKVDLRRYCPSCVKRTNALMCGCGTPTREPPPLKKEGFEERMCFAFYHLEKRVKALEERIELLEDESRQRER